MTRLEQELIEHKKLEARLEDALSFSQSIVETVRESLLVLDGDLRVRQANSSFYRAFQAAPGDTEGRLVHELGNGQWDIPDLRALLEQILLEEVPPHNTGLEDFEVEQDFPEIGLKIMRLHARRIGGEDGHGRMLLLAIEDVTAHRLAERQVQMYVQKLEWSNRELEDFAYIASHDLQEPLRAIQAFSERLQTKHGNALNEEARDYLNRMVGAAGRMRILIRDLLNYSRVTTKARPFTSVNLATVAASAVSDLAARLEETGGRVEVGELPTVQGDATQLRQLLQNLIDNGIKFRRPGVAPVVAIEPVVPSGTGAGPLLNTASPYCQIAVRDNGIGFEPEYADRIFNPFERLHDQDQYPGSGIGLAICRKIAERHGGSIVAGSIVAGSILGEGSEFLISLPLRQPRASLPEDPAGANTL